MLSICFSLFKCPIEKCCRDFDLSRRGPAYFLTHSAWGRASGLCSCEIFLLKCMFSFGGFADALWSRSPVLRFVEIQHVSPREALKEFTNLGRKRWLFNFISRYCLHFICLFFYDLFLFCLGFSKRCLHLTFWAIWF